MDPALTLIPPPKLRRTKALTDQARDLFETALLSDGWQPGATIPAIAKATGLTADQVRDAIFAPAADAWRAALTARINGAPWLF